MSRLALGLCSVLIAASLSSSVQAAGKIAMARRAILELPGVKKLQAGRRIPVDADKAMRLHFVGDTAFVASVSEDANHCVGCEVVYLGQIKGQEVSLSLITPAHPAIASQLQNAAPWANAYSFYLPEGGKNVMMRGYGGALKPFKLQADGTLRGGKAFLPTPVVGFDGNYTGRTKRMVIPE